jgi:hypothetical protein
MNKTKLLKLKELLNEFLDLDDFGMGEMTEIEQVKTVIDLVDGAIINQDENN